MRTPHVPPQTRRRPKRYARTAGRAHAAPDLAAMGADLLVCSPYKFFGPHVGVLFARRDLLAAWPAYKVRPATEVLPHRWETGMQNHEGDAGTTAAIDYVASLGEGADQIGRAHV